jgi:hypothetical protein
VVHKNVPLTNETKVGLVNERGALKCVIGTFLSKMPAGQPPQLVVD